MKKCFSYILFFCLFLVPRGMAEPDSGSLHRYDEAYRLRKPGENFLQVFREDPAFDYTEATPGSDWWQDLKIWLMRHIFHIDMSGDMDWLVLMMEIAGVLLLIFLIYLLVRNKSLFVFGHNDVPIPEDGLAGKELNTLSYPQLLDKAVGEQNYILAVRIHYRYILYLLNRREMIRWDASKTNVSYCYELKDDKLKKKFNRLSWIFDCVCYGDFSVDDGLYKELSEEFKEFEQEVLK